MIAQATRSLAELDSARLEELGLRALGLAERGGMRLAPFAGAELKARLRVLSLAIAGTRSNLDFLEAVATGGAHKRDTFGDSAARGFGWDR